MNRNLRKLWLIVPDQLPVVIRRCPKCNEKRDFLNSGKFRVNANGKLLDVWLIYRCSHCDTSFSMTIIERTKKESLNKEEYEGFLGNSEALAAKYGSDKELFLKNKVEISEINTGYHIIETITTVPVTTKSHTEIQIRNPSGLKPRADTLLSNQYAISRSKMKKWFEDGLLTSGLKVLNPGTKVSDGMVLEIKRNEEYQSEELTNTVKNGIVHGR